MSSILSKIMKRLFSERIKQIVIIQSLLLIPALVYIIYLITVSEINYFYNGLFFILLGLIYLLLCFENYILKKKAYIFYNLIFSLGCVLAGIYSLQK